LAQFQAFFPCAPRSLCASRQCKFYTGNSLPMRHALYVRRASVNFTLETLSHAPRSLCASCSFLGNFWRPSRCPNWVQDSSLERALSLISNPAGIFQFGVHLPYQKSNLPRLVKMCLVRLPQGRVLLQSTFECLPQLQIELMIAHWKSLSV